MSVNLNLPYPERRKKVLLLASNPAVSPVTGWPLGFWWAELTHPYWAFMENGYEVAIASPEGGELSGDSWSDPRDVSEYSADDLISLGFINSPAHMEQVSSSLKMPDCRPAEYDALFLVGGQGPMVTFYENEAVHRFVSDFYESGKIVAVVCHATCVLLKCRLGDGSLLVADRTWTGFANSEEKFADDFVGQKLQPFWIEDKAAVMKDTHFIVDSRFKPHAVRDGRLVTGQQQYSGAAAARLVIEALGL